MTHFHLKYFAPARPGVANLDTFFDSEIDALHAAGLANATRGKETGYYGIQECRRVQCERQRRQASGLGLKPRPAARRVKVPRAPGW